MMRSTRRNKIGATLVAAGVLLFVLPAVFPVQLVPVHDTSPATNGNETQLEENGVTVIAYGNLSERGQELYVESLNRPGEYRVTSGEGAPEFPYPSPEEVRERQSDGDRAGAGVVAIDRAGHDTLPPADEFRGRTGAVSERSDGGGGGADSAEDAEQQREIRERYDLMETRLGQPPLDAPAQLGRLVAVLLAVICLGMGGYLLSSRQ